MAFQDLDLRKGIFRSPFIGFRNFEFLFTTTDAWRITRNTLCYNIVFIILNTSLAVILAILLNEISHKRIAKGLQTIYIMPNFLSMAVVAIIVFAFLSADNGYLNKVMESLGYDSKNWYLERKPWPLFFIIINAWKHVGFSSVVYLASISGISPEYYEAAVLDGAKKI